MKPSTHDRVEGKYENLKGKAKEAAGAALKKPALEAEGRNQKIAGKVQEKVGQVEKVLGK